MDNDVYVLNFSFLKRRSLAICLPSKNLRAIASLAELPQGASVAVWGMRDIPPAAAEQYKVIRIEDGFLRSVGLGAELAAPSSWVLDYHGIYFDPSRPSDLEIILAKTKFTPVLLARAESLRKKIVALGLSKYNVGHTRWTRPPKTKRVILVPGQVESDASLAFGAPEIKTNMSLLQAVRSANPESYIVYKPHPDVVAGLRRAGMKEEIASEFCDEVLPSANIADLLDKVDEVHCMTSLAGFEALLRQKTVVCYGKPFYAGWGLTRDMLALPQRNRQLSLDEMVAGTLILYPKYISHLRVCLISPEEAIDELAIQLHKQKNAFSWKQKLWRALLRITVGVK